MGMKPRRKLVTTDSGRVSCSEANEPRPSPKREPILVASLGAFSDNPDGWHAIHQFLGDFESQWNLLTPIGKSALLRSMSLFIGAACAESNDKTAALALAQSIVRSGFIDYQTERRNVLQAVTTAHVFEQGDQTVN